MRGVVATSVLLLSLQGIHGLDHLLFQDRALPVAVGIVGVVEGTAVVVVLMLALAKRPQAPLAAVIVGLAIATAFAVVHLAPDWGFLSDPYAEASLETHSWAIMFTGIAAGLALALAGALALRAPATRAAS